MMIDASAFLAILLEEPDGPEMAQRIALAKAPYTSPLAVYETCARLMNARQIAANDAQDMLRELLDEAAVRVVPITEGMTSVALGAFEKYGRSRHPAALNFGDCFAYACARAYRARLLFKGNDFSQTDINDSVRH
ncbi:MULTISPECIES: type II toxin-antitoxin system VapC family toxin [Methylocystis]|uniref:type II toxin-antitoxin system VapC family toxin n=1 Tax=Methylocystis TaxID=133 RepID=UPI0024B8DD6B|nr:MULTISPECIES: type II toxin-antitoxin system VapC family toxin [Methylocystis]MDJ0450979.1 type II toxin-antitoxin system VapC family toxin [Methylocystis sp. JR02]